MIPFQFQMCTLCYLFICLSVEFESSKVYHSKYRHIKSNRNFNKNDFYSYLLLAGAELEALVSTFQRPGTKGHLPVSPSNSFAGESPLKNLTCLSKGKRPQKSTQQRSHEGLPLQLWGAEPRFAKLLLSCSQPFFCLLLSSYLPSLGWCKMSYKTDGSSQIVFC